MKKRVRLHCRNGPPAAAPGQALADFSIFRLIARYWGCGELFREWTSPAAVFQILKRLSEGQPCDFSGIRDYRMIEERGGIQWPFSKEDFSIVDNSDHPSGGALRGAGMARRGRRLFTDGRFFHPDGRARFLFEDPRPMREPPSEGFPFLLPTGRGAASQWHTETRTKNAAVLRKLAPRNVYVLVNPADARRLGIQPDEMVFVESQRRRIKARAFHSRSVQPGQVFVPMH